LYYKLAVDVNGNESGYALLTRVASGVRTGADLRPGAAVEPARGGRLSVSFTLPATRPARWICSTCTADG
jgi:hypothetical protein